MNTFTSIRGFGKGVSLWIQATVFLAVLALMFALLPSTSIARADEVALDDLTISEFADEPILIDEEVAPPENDEQGPDIVDDAPVEGIVDEEDLAPEEEGSFLDDVLGMFDPAQIAPQQLGGREIPVDITVEGFVIPAEREGNIYVGDTIGLNGTWVAQDLNARLQPGDYFYIPVYDPLKIVEDGPRPLGGPAGAVWGQCTTEAAQNRYRCEFGNDFQADTSGARGTWGGNADASEEFNGRYEGLDLVIQAPLAVTYGIDKTRVLGYDRNLSPWMGDAPAGTMINYTAVLTSTDYSTITEDIVLRDSFDSKLTLCAEDDIAITQIGPLAFETAIDGNEIVFTIERPASGFHPTVPISINYFLCTASGGMDPKGTFYDNRIEGTLETILGDAFVFDEVDVEQWRETWFNAEGVDRGSFELFKVVDEDALPEGYTLVDEPFTVQVQEFTPDGDLETTYQVTVDANDGSPVRGHNARPAGWTIRLSEIAFPNAPPGYDWGTPVFSGDGVTTGVGANGPYGEIITTQEGNIGITLTNILNSINPDIETLATVQGSVENVLPLTGGTVIDTVSYQNLQPNTLYELQGRIVAVDEDDNVTETGITASGTFTTGEGNPLVNGTAEIEFTISAEDAERWANQKLVVYELLFDLDGPTPDVPLVIHEDPTDIAQTFFVDEGEPLIGTLAEVQGVDNPKVLPITGGTVVDTVSYKFLEPETEYRFDGELMNVVGTTATATGITASTTFTTPAAAAGESYVSGTQTVTFTITGAQAVEYAGKTLVVYERAFDTQGPTPDVPVAVHEDPNDEAQTFVVDRVPEIGTLAEVQGVDNPKLLPITGGTVVDTVSYTDLTPETEYRFDGELMNVVGTTATATGITASTTFTTPAAAAGESYVSGTQTVTFTITGAQAVEYAGKTLVVYERAFDLDGPTPDVPVAVHEDPEDEAQSFIVERKPEIGTLAEVQGVDNPKVLPITGGTVVDTVSYTDLKPETEYRFDGELMNVVGTTATATGITASTTFTTPAAAAGESYVSGTQTVTFTITGAQAVEYAGKTLVVYERAFDLDGPTPDVPVAVHEDPEDEAQSFDIEPGGIIVVTKTVSGPKGDAVENDEDAEFQIRAEWVDGQGNTQTRTFNVTPGQPVELVGLPLDTEIVLTEVGADTSVSNVKWGDIIWSGEGVVDQSGDSASGIITLENPGATVQVGLENKTSSNALIIIPIPIPLIPGGGSSEPPAPTEPVAPLEPAPPVTPDEDVAGAVPTQPGDKVAAQQPQPRGLAVTGADVMWIAGGGLSVLLLGAWLVLRGRRNES